MTYDADDRRKDAWIDRNSPGMSYVDSIKLALRDGQALRLKKLWNDIAEIELACEVQGALFHLRAAQNELGAAIRIMTGQ